MHKVRLIPILLLKDQRMVKGKQFSNFRDTGDPAFAARIYNAQFVDELIFLDITATPFTSLLVSFSQTLLSFI